jgi:thiol:disulfide interchange protein
MKSMNFVVLAFSLVLTFLRGSVGFSQIELPEDKVSWKFKVEQKDCEATVIAEVTMAPYWHINSIVLPKGTFGYASKFQLNKSTDYKIIGVVSEPKPIQKHDEESDEDLSYHEGKVIFKYKIKILANKDFVLKGIYAFQTCNEDHCLAPYEDGFSVKVKGCTDGTAQMTDSGDEGSGEVMAAPEKDSPIKDTKNPDVKKKKSKEKDKNKSDRSILTIFILSFLSGMAALMTPCVFPMIPMTVSFFTKQSKTKAKGIRNAFLYSFFIIVIYITLGVVVTGVFGAEVLNKMSTNPWFNFIFFLILVIFAISFMGAFEIRMPSKWVNKADQASDRGGVIGIFFMALALALVSFSCTGPIVGSLLVEAASKGGITPVIGMFGFSLALALPFGLFAAFPGWMNSLPKSGGWLNTVKVVLGILELALALKFLSNADYGLQLHYLERELFIAAWIAIFGLLAIYLFGFVTFPHDSKVERLSVGRILFGTTVLMFVIYMIPGMWGAPLKLINAFPPPSNYSESPLGVGGGGGGSAEDGNVDTHLGPQNIMVFHDFDKAEAYAKEVGKPLFVDFTGYQCVNCRKMEENVWGEKGVIEHLRDEVVIVSLHVDDLKELPVDEQITVKWPNGKMKKLITYGDKWMYKEISEYEIAAQPYYIMKSPDGENLSNGSADYEHHSNPKDFQKWLEKGLKEYKK